MKKYLPLLLLAILLFKASDILAQMEGTNLVLINEVDNTSVGFHFGCTGAVPFTLDQSLSKNAYNSISDTSGNILFYISNTEIYDTYGTAIVKFDSSNNTPVYPPFIVPHPANYDEYYIFYGDYSGNNIHNPIQKFSLYNIKTKTIVQKDSFAANNLFCAAARHRNKKYYWITYTDDSTHLYSYLIDSNGLHKNGIGSHFSTLFNPGPHLSNYYQFSPGAGKLYGSTYLDPDSNVVLSLDFDDSSGIFSNPEKLVYYSSYNEDGFPLLSPDGRRLYFKVYCNIGGGCQYPLYQYDLSSGSPNAIVKSRTMISQYVDGIFQGPDTKIYASGVAYQAHTGYVATINKPDSLGTICNYTIDSTLPHDFLYSINLYTNTLTRQGFWPSFSIDTDTYNAFVLHLSYNDPRPGNKYKWNFGDPASGPLNHDTGAFVTHVYPIGVDTIRLVVTDQYGYDEVFKRAVCINSPFVHRVQDTVICAGSSITLNSGNPTSTHLWSTGDTSQLVTLTNAGKYWVRFQFHNLQATDTFILKYDHSFSGHKFLPHDTTICEGKPITINLDSIHGAITWQDTIVSKTFTVSQTGTYHASLQNACGTYKDSIHVTAVPCNIFNINVFPNPFENTAQIQVQLSNPSHIQIRVYDAIGKLITTLADAQQSIGPTTYTLDAEKYNLAPGVYFIKIVIDDKIYIRPVVRL